MVRKKNEKFSISREMMQQQWQWIIRREKRKSPSEP